MLILITFTIDIKILNINFLFFDAHVAQSGFVK